MRELVLSLAIVCQSNLLFAIDCRQAVIEAYEAIGKDLDEHRFSRRSFEEFEMSVDEFNLLAPEEQQEIYTQIRPLKSMVLATIHTLSGQINRYANTFYEMYMLDEIQLWRKHVDELRSCQT